MRDPNFGISAKSARLIRQVLTEFDTIDRVIIFGSRAKGNYHKGSDIDLAIYGKNLPRQTPLDLSAQLNERTPIPYFVDVLAPDFLDNSALIDHIQRVGVVFYEKTPSKTKASSRLT